MKFKLNLPKMEMTALMDADTTLWIWLETLTMEELPARPGASCNYYNIVVHLTCQT